MLFDSNLSFDSHVSSICKTAFFHLKNISKLRPMLSISNAEMLIHAFMTLFMRLFMHFFSPFCHRWSFDPLPLSPLACLVGDTSFPAISPT